MAANGGGRVGGGEDARQRSEDIGPRSGVGGQDGGIEDSRHGATVGGRAGARELPRGILPRCP